MVKRRLKRLAAGNDSVIERLAGIKRAMTVRSDEDIVDHADITYYRSLVQVGNDGPIPRGGIIK
jgi:hypothetical protein